MKRSCLILFVSVLATTLFAAIPTRYYVGKIEVSESFWNQMPDSIDYISGEFNCDTLTIRSRELPFTHYIDSVSTPGRYIISKRSAEVIAELERMYSVINRTWKSHVRLTPCDKCD